MASWNPSTEYQCALVVLKKQMGKKNMKFFCYAIFIEKKHPFLSNLHHHFVLEYVQVQIHRIRIIELFRLKRTFNDHLVYLPCHWLGCISLDQVAQSFVQPGFECFQWQGIHSSSGNMFHCLTIFIIKIFFLMSNQNLHSA